VIVVATADFEVYHGAVNELRDRGLAFTTIEPGEDLPKGTRVLLLGPDADPDAEWGDPGTDPASRGDAEGENAAEGEVRTAADAGGGNEAAADDGGEAVGIEDVEVVIAGPAEPRRAVDEALAALRGGGGRTVIGVDPGERPGIAVRSGGVVVAAFQVPLAEAAALIRREAEKATEASGTVDGGDPVVRIGDGARLQGTSIVDDLGDLTTELVDETGTTPHLGSGARGMGDVLAAANIARLPGERATEREIEPTAGEIEAIKRRSRERSNGDRTIDENLARRVARGELSVEEALEEHRDG
jgi:hypothetical protein